MRVLMTTDTVGGVWTYTRELVLGLLGVRQDTQVMLVTFGGDLSAEQAAWLKTMALQFRKRFLFETTNLPLEWQRENAKAYVYAEPLLRRLAKQFAPDIFHSSQICFGALPLRCPKVIVAHSDVLSWARVVRGSSLESSDWLENYVAMVTAGLAGADAVVAPTAAMLADLRQDFGAVAHGSVIANGRSVDPPRMSKKLQAITAGRVWDAAKGMAVLEEAMTPMPVLVAGEISSPDATYDAARLRRRVLLGRLGETAMLGHFSESSVYLMTSVYEPFGLSAVEAAQCGCAIVARDIPSQREVWGDDALYFTDADGLCNVLERMAKTHERLHEMQDRATVRARKLYSRGRMTEGYLRLYESRAGAAGAAGA